VRQFAVGVWGLNVSHDRLLGISSSGNDGSGLGFTPGTHSLIRNCSGSLDGGGMFLRASHHVRVLHNSFRHNGEPGIFIGFESTHNLIKGNRTSRNGAAGITMEGGQGANRNQVRRNPAFETATASLSPPATET
jgi:hypothetical protein